MTGPHSKDDYLLCSVQCFEIILLFFHIHPFLPNGVKTYYLVFDIVKWLLGCAS